jgi:hypothetical protein
LRQSPSPRAVSRDFEGRAGAAVAWHAYGVAPWKLPLVVAAIAVPVAAAFAVGGPGVGVAVGALAAVAIVVYAVRDRPRGAIGSAPPADGRRRLLVVLGQALEDQAAVAAVAAIAKDGPGRAAETLVLAPARIGFLDRWASDVEAARREAQQRLVITIASLAKAGIVAEGRVGDEDLVQAVEDQLQSFRASDVVLVTAGADADPAAAAAGDELQDRLRARFRRLEVRGPAAG